MKISFYIFIFTVFLSKNNLYSQELLLDISSKDSLENSFFKKNPPKKLHFTEDKLKKYLDSFSESLKHKGYFYNNISSFTKKKKHFFYVFKLGKRTDSIKLFLKELNKQKKDTTITVSSLQSFLNTIKNNLENKGNSFSKVSLKNIVSKKNKLIATIKVKESKKRFIDKIIIKGYNKFPKKFLRHFLKLDTRTIFNQQTIESITKNIESIDFVKQKKQPQVLFSKDSTILYLYLEKLKNSYFDGDLNLAPSIKKNGLQFSGNINLKFNNIINTGEVFNLTWNANGNERQNINLYLKTPFIFNTPLTSKNQLIIHKQDSSFLNTKFKTSLLYQLTPKINFGILFESENSTNTLEKKLNNIESFSTAFLGSEFSYSIPKTHSLFKNLFSFKVNYFLGKRDNSKTNTTQQKLKLETSYLFSINNKNHIFIKSESAFLKSTDYLQNELFRIGGFNSIRGFNQQSILSSKYSFLNLEYRLLTSNKSFLYSITDFGIIKDIKNATSNALGYGIGYFHKRKNSTINIALISNYSQPNNQNNLNLSISISSFF